ncbi:uncharacterized protein LOC101736091 [Bombyx mori]|uniref:Uncharacterized protein n=1 Tax=Bombyx mori TaxID=7091 RepID=A0A8R2C5T0_BOMMO|nr:uncharacterized protein LOC101736091 [Bombyx mori]
MVLRRRYSKEFGRKATPIPKYFSEITFDESSESETFESETSSYTTYSGESETTTVTTEDTLSMISTPWSSETWDSAVFNSANSEKTLTPKSSTSYGATTPFFSVSSKNTLTLLESAVSLNESHVMKPTIRATQSMSSGTLSSWTLESFTSTGLIDSDILKVEYPWSPCTDMSGTDVYPSSVDTFESRKGSRAAMNTLSKRELFPMNYLCTPHEDTVLDWMLVKNKGICVS